MKVQLSDIKLIEYHQEAVALLSQLISTPSLSREEVQTAGIIAEFLASKGIKIQRFKHNVWAKNTHFNPNLPTILLNSHHDTVKPNAGYIIDPYAPIIVDGKLYGLGSNDAGGALVCLLIAFCHFANEQMPFNLIFAATAEEEISGENGIAAILEHFPKIETAIVGEPTGMQIAEAEKGLMVLDCYAKGTSGHAARQTGVNAIYEAMKSIHWFQHYQFDRISDRLGAIHMNVTMIQSGYQHNVIPDNCHFVVDVRTTDVYTHEEILDVCQKNAGCEVKARSLRLKPSALPKESVVYQAAKSLGIEFFGSPTLSDQALIPFQSCKMGPGLSERSHTADEFILLDEIQQGISGYIQLINQIIELKTLNK